MFTFTEPMQQLWALSQGEKEVSINKDVAVNLKNPDIIAINFLYQNFNNKLRGSILNEEDGFTTQLQVSVFLNIIFKQCFTPKENLLIVVITPEYLMQKWNDKLEKIGGFKIKIVDSTTCPADFDQQNGLVLLVSFENIKLADILAEYRLFSVVIDHFDIVAAKLVVKKLCGDFNIGITRRNFYTNPDQKLQWTMLNWANPNSVGRLMEYYEADNDNYSNLRDNYHHWWLTLTWEFCENFTKYVDDEDDSQPLQHVKTTKIYKGRKRKLAKATNKSSLLSCEDEETTNSINEEKSTDAEMCQTNNEESKMSDSDSNQNLKITGKEVKEEDRNASVFDTSNSSQDTIEYNLEEIMPTAEESKTEIYEDNDVLMGIIEGTSGQDSLVELDHESQVHLKKEELYSQIFDDIPVPDIHNQTSDSSEAFLLSLI